MPVNKKDIIPERYDKKLKDCFQPTEVLMAALCNRWSLKVLFALKENGGPMKFNRIREASSSTSDKMMNQALKNLQDYKLVCTQPSGYSLTDRGQSLLKVLHPLEKWVDDIKQDFAVELMNRTDKAEERARKEERDMVNKQWDELNALCEQEDMSVPFRGYQNPKLIMFDAEQGDVESMYYLGMFYENGEDEIEQDYAKAMEWYKKAAKKRDTDSMFAIAKLYEEGKGVEKNLKEAQKWMQKAANWGDENAIKWLEEHNKEETSSI